MSNHKFLVELPDGTLVRKSRAEMQPDDMVVFDGPDAFASADALKVALDAEIEAAGGLEAWRAMARAKDRDPKGGDPQGLRGEAIEPAREATRPEAVSTLLTDLRDLHGMALDAAQQVQGREGGHG